MGVVGLAGFAFEGLGQHVSDGGNVSHGGHGGWELFVVVDVVGG